MVVEVATGSRFSGLVGRVAERETRWFAPIRAKMATDGLAEQASWPIRFLGFVRAFVRIHKTLRVTPAMAAGVSDRLWDVSDIVALVEAREAPPAKRGPYQKREKADG